MYVQYNACTHTGKLKKIGLFSRDFFSGNISDRAKYHHRSQETSCTEILKY